MDVIVVVRKRVSDLASAIGLLSSATRMCASGTAAPTRAVMRSTLPLSLYVGMIARILPRSLNDSGSMGATVVGSLAVWSTGSSGNAEIGSDTAVPFVRWSSNPTPSGWLSRHGCAEGSPSLRVSP